jgi:DNA-binding Lrp family transcriptional regulator
VRETLRTWRSSATVARVNGLDAVDAQIVALLRENARRSFQDIGGRVNLSAPAVKRRVDRLQEAGIVRGYTAVVDPAQLGWPTLAIVHLYCDGRMTGSEIERAVAPMPEVAAAYTVAGAASAVLLLRTADTLHLERALERIRDTDGVLRTETSVVFSTLLERPFALREGMP